MFRLASIIFMILVIREVAGADSGSELHEIRVRIESGKPNSSEASDLSQLEGIANGKTAFAGRATAVLAFFHRKKETITERVKDKLKAFVLTKDGSWNLDERECCLEYARIKAHEDFPAAMQVIDKLGQSGSGVLRMLAAEAAGDVFLIGKRFKEAEDAYRLAKRIFDSDGYLKDDPLAKLALERVKRSLEAARRPLDVEKYGEDFVLYREAEVQRRQKKNYAVALEIYGQIIKRFPDTIYAEASHLYELLCMVKTGKVEHAERGLETFCAKNKYGLYRGEAMLELGRIALERKVDPALARTRFDELEKWLAAVEEHDKELPAFSIKDAAKDVTKPPAVEKGMDNWGNVKKQKIVPGQLVNRRTCAWYLDEIREQCCTFRGFLFLVEGKQKEALACFDKIREFDAEPGQTDGPGSFNNRDRLTWGAEHGYLCAYPPELALYQGKQRLAVLLGDLYYCTENFEQGEEVFKRLLNGEFGALRGAVADYPRLALAHCIYWIRGREASIPEYEKVLEKREGTFTEDQAAYCIGNISRECTDKKIQARGQELLRELIACGRANEYTWKARIEYAKDLFAQKKDKECLSLLAAMPESAGDYYHVAKFYIEDFQKRRKEEQE